MGNAALEVFADITEDGNKWKEDGFKLPSHAEVLSNTNLRRSYQDPGGFGGGRGRTGHGNDDSADASPGCSPPRLLVAPVASTHQGSRHYYEESMGSERSSSSSKPIDCVERPLQVVLQPGIVQEIRGARTTGYAWRPLNHCSAMRKRGPLLTEGRLSALQTHLPVATRFSSCWKLIYCPAVHGVSLKTFYRQCQTWPGETLLLVEDTDGKVFGCFASQTWRTTSQLEHYGTAECFVFQFAEDGGISGEAADEESSLHVYPWAGGNRYFMFADSNGFSMGGGRGLALSIRSDFLRGCSCASETFGNPGPLSSQEDFVIRSFECWTFDHGSLGLNPAGPDDPWEGLQPFSSNKPLLDEGIGEESPGFSNAAKARSEAREVMRYRFG
mmetsp:Transcript_73813/g.153823  ORF Transcript_73813/g.153823 Transcript_73813/m.153823 type:complete len:385 (-) Transcript_73813:163-1317(-)|eukprot:CAMPEP_0206428618 /NCGR_PEP_ID=MMETSP0324_2-20121206/5774_1 /ASSEMBLY_ACC=CAM_ASM_000836 /TAXON_ID=2866 /ORGANISM="Crypthecodinium cohnii, Strain Seligo" /LENGTH=384 /DNA_ID=CAMNT_0053894185 /DNA_START=53 /DNA_END=1207 /DNA_ORIENTATION=+